MGSPSLAALAAGAALLEHRAALLLGFPAASTASMGRLADQGTPSAELTLMRAWSEAAAGAADQARATVRPLLDGRRPMTLASTLVEAWLVEVWGALRSGDRPAARQALRAALSWPNSSTSSGRSRSPARASGYCSWTSWAGTGIRTSSRSVAWPLDARSRRPADPQLSAREQDVLAQLVSLSNLGEIADDLEVSVNTVKSHVRAIYGKLGVNTRRNAILTALERGMLA